MRVLIIEDDSRAARYLLRGLSESGHVVDHAAEGETGLALALEGIYDALIVDRRLPALDGLTLVRRLRAKGAMMPVLMLSAIGSSADKVKGLQAGCDDYLAKPYAFGEVLARLELAGAPGGPDAAAGGVARRRPRAGYPGAAGQPRRSAGATPVP